jgi:prepilin-type N-terminal cleavage/methylation domain-containing protein
MRKKFSTGFTLIELLVVIAIIGILSAVVLTSLSTSRQKARVAAVEESLHSLQTAGHVCLNDSSLVNVPQEDNTGGGGPLCTGSASNFVTLPTNWIYCDNTPGTQSPTDCGNETSSSTLTSFGITAESDADGTVVSCSDAVCSTYQDND